MLIICLALLVINSLYKTLTAYRFKYFTGILFFVLFIFLGGLLSYLTNDLLRPTYFGNHSYQQLKVRIDDEPQEKNNRFRFTAKVITAYDQQKPFQVSGKMLVNLTNDSLNPISYSYGDELIISTNSSPITPPFNPGEFDFRGWLALKNIHLQTFTESSKTLKTSQNCGNPILAYALSLRKRQIEIYRKLVKNNEAFAVASTLILGYRADLGSDTLASYSKTGTIHALSVSGMHVAIIYVVLNWLLSFMDRSKGLKIIKILTICLLIWFYSLLTGFSSSVLRSAIMLTVYILAKTFNKHTNSYNILAFTAFCLLIYNPYLIWDVGFQLSFLAVLGLIYLHPKIYKWLYFKQKWADWIWSSVSLSLAAQITTFPFSIYYFHQFPLYFIGSNLFILIPLTLLMYLGISILLFKLYCLAPIFEWLIMFMNNGLTWIANLPFSGINQIWLDSIQLLLLVLALGIGLIALVNYHKRLLLTSILLFLILQFSLTLHTIQLQIQKKMIFFSLQKGYAMAFIHAQKAILVSNLNSNDKNFQFYIQPALDQLQVNNIRFMRWEIDTNLHFFIKKHHQINFNGYRILLMDPYFNHKFINRTPSFNMVYLHNNPKFTIENLTKSVVFKTLLMDATNYTSKLKYYTQEANKFQIHSHVLKKNKAYLIDLNNLSE